MDSHYIENITMLEYNLFGDPSLVREGIENQVTPSPAPTFTPTPVIAHEDHFENGILVCTGPYGAAACETAWAAHDPTDGGYPPACDGTNVAWHTYEACNYPHGPDHLLIMNGTTNPNHDMTGYRDIAISLDWYYNNDAYGETVEIWQEFSIKARAC